MALIDLWQRDRPQIIEKHIQQIIGFAGDGKLLDDSVASSEFRAFLRNVPSDLLSRYVDQCLQDTFTDSGLALQDLVNEIGRRLDFTITPGRYRGSRTHIGYDGLWTDANRHNIIVEVKTTDAYRIKLDTIAGYRQTLDMTDVIVLDMSSMLVVVGREDTGELEAQIRGSRHAWDMRLISVDALLRMLKLREEVEDPSILGRIHGILVPHEFTRLDPIVEIAFAAVEDVKIESAMVVSGEEDEEDEKLAPVAFHAECIDRIEKYLQVTLVKKSRASFASPDEKVRIICSVSRYHERNKRYWFAFHPHQDQFLSVADQGYVAFGCGNASILFLIPFADFKPWLDLFNKTEKKDLFYWHVQIRPSDTIFTIKGRSDTKSIDITKYKI